MNQAPKEIIMKGKWRVISFIPKRCRKPRYMVGIRLSNGTGGTGLLPSRL